MGRQRIETETLLSTLRRRKVMTKTEMIELLGCSAMSLWRVLSVRGYLTSYNFNARYYTLREIPRFDSNGLWFHERIGFSAHGSLTETVRNLTADSRRGLTCAELRESLAVNVGPTLRGLCRGGALSRQKYGGVFVYLAAEPNRRRSQVNERLAGVAEPPAGTPSAGVVVAILVELIQRVELTPSEVAARLLRRNLTVSEDQVRQVFHQYDLQPVKKGLCTC